MERKFFIKKKSCRICGNKSLIKFLELGPQPLANRLLKESELLKKELFFPLDVYFCDNCNLAQLIDVVDKRLLFSDYVYFSSGMPKLSDHFKIYAEYAIKNFLKTPDDLVVEIGSNDGILLNFFQKAGYRVFGVDPAKNIVQVALVDTLNDFFSEKVAEKIVSEKGKAKLIMGNNVVAHIDNHHDLVKGVYKILDKDGVFIFEAPYLADMFENLTYDTVYHEHLSFLATRPLIYLFKQFDMEIFDVMLLPVQGQSIRVFAGKKGMHTIKPSVNNFIDKEKKMGFDKKESYFTLAEKIKNLKNALCQTLGNLKKEEKKIAAYGAPAKGNTLLNYCKIGKNILDYAIDDLPSKKGLYTPGTHIPILPSLEIKNNPPDYLLLLAWNYASVILEKEKDYREKGGKFIIPCPEVKII